MTAKPIASPAFAPSVRTLSESNLHRRPLFEMMTVLIIVLCLGALDCSAVETTKTGGIKEDFEAIMFDDDMALEWEPGRGTKAEKSELGNSATLHIRNTGEVSLLNQKFACFALSVQVNGSGGVRFGKKTSVTISGGSLQIHGLPGKPTEIPLKIAASEKKKGDFRAFSPNKPHQLKIVRAPTFLRVFVDGRQEADIDMGKAVKAPITLTAVGKGAFFDNLSIEPNLFPGDGIRAVPDVKDEAVVFDNSSDIIMNVRAANHSNQPVDLTVSVCPVQATALSNYKELKPGAEMVKFGVGSYYALRPLLSERIAQAEARIKPAEKEQSLQVKLGKIPTGFYLLDFCFKREGKTVYNSIYPCAVGPTKLTKSDEKPTMIIGAYTAKMPGHMRESGPFYKPFWWKTYLHATAQLLQHYHFNAVVSHGDFGPDTMNVLRQHGIWTIQRGDSYLDDPAVIGTLIGDEPHGDEVDYYVGEYKKIQGKTDKPVMTCTIGGYLGVEGKNFFWDAVKPRARVFRWYQVKKSFYGIQHPTIYKGASPLETDLLSAKQMFNSPYWLIIPSFGRDEHEAYFQYPSPAETRGMMHLAMAYCAKGILFWELQDACGLGLIDKATLKPIRNNLKTIGKVALDIEKHAGLLTTLDVGKLDVRCELPDAEVVPLHDEKDGRYVYVINKDTRQKRSYRIFWPGKLGRTKVKDIYKDKSIPVKTGKDFVSFEVELEPGDGRLFAVGK